jgi:hypothetical protein
MSGSDARTSAAHVRSSSRSSSNESTCGWFQTPVVRSELGHAAKKSDAPNPINAKLWSGVATVSNNKELKK